MGSIRVALEAGECRWKAGAFSSTEELMNVKKMSVDTMVLRRGAQGGQHLGNRF